MKYLLLDGKHISGARGAIFDLVYMGSSTIIRLCCHIYFNQFNNHNHIGVTALRGRGLQSPCKRSRYCNRAIGNSNERGTQNNSQKSSLWSK